MGRRGIVTKGDYESELTFLWLPVSDIVGRKKKSRPWVTRPALNREILLVPSVLRRT